MFPCDSHDLDIITDSKETVAYILIWDYNNIHNDCGLCIIHVYDNSDRKFVVVPKSFFFQEIYVCKPFSHSTVICSR